MSVLLLLVYNMPLGVSAVCGVLSLCWGVCVCVLWVHGMSVCAYHVCLCYLPCVSCTWLEGPCGVMCLHGSVCACLCVVFVVV